MKRTSSNRVRLRLVFIIYDFAFLERDLLLSRENIYQSFRRI